MTVHRKRVLFGTPMTGLMRSEYFLSFMAMAIPTNWAHVTYAHIFNLYSPLRFLVADARNLIVQKAVNEDFEWLIFIDHDVLVPKDLLIKFNRYMLRGDVPIVGGLYFTRSVPASPLLYRGRGNSYFTKWKMGEKVWVDGMGLGLHLIHVSILKEMYRDAVSYVVEGKTTAKRVFNSPYDFLVEGNTEFKMTGTEDLPWYTRIMKEGYFKKAGWPEYQKKKYPFLCDTSIFAQHIDEAGRRYPSIGEEKQFK